MAGKKKEEPEKEFQLEDAFGQLEQIIERLEKEETPLQEAITLYGAGAKLLASCKQELYDIEKEMLVIGESLEEGEKE